eukprot:scaffold1141_cov333-Pavlova_lutheri.AAC.24
MHYRLPTTAVFCDGVTQSLRSLPRLETTGVGVHSPWTNTFFPERSETCGADPPFIPEGYRPPTTPPEKKLPPGGPAPGSPSLFPDPTGISNGSLPSWTEGEGRVDEPYVNRFSRPSIPLVPSPESIA